MAFREFGGSDSGCAHGLPRAAVSMELDNEAGEGEALGGVRKLMAALLFNSIQNYMSYTLATSESQKIKYQEAYEWVHSDDREYIFSFLNVCESLGVSSSWLRKGLEKRCIAYRLDGNRPRRTF